MRFECVSFVPWGGQLRFAIEADRVVVPDHKHDPMVSHSGSGACGRYGNEFDLPLTKRHINLIESARQLALSVELNNGQTRKFPLSGGTYVEIFRVEAA